MSELEGAVALAQIRKAEDMLAGYRRAKKRIKDAITPTGSMSFRRITDESGNTAISLIFFLPTADHAQHALPAIKRVCKHRAFVYMGGFPAEPKDAVAAYTDVMEQMAPDVIVIPALTISAANRPEQLYGQMRRISAEYAARMDFGWMDCSPSVAFAG